MPTSPIYQLTNTGTVTIGTSPLTFQRLSDPVTLNQETLGQELYPRSDAEIASGITPTSYYYPYGDVRRFGAVGDGSTDDTSAFEDALAAGAHITLPAGYDFVINDVQIPDQDITVIDIQGDTIVRGSTGTYCFEQQNRGNFVRIKGGDFRGPIPGFRYTDTGGVLPHPTSYQEYSLEGCRFQMDANVYGVSLYGAREGRMIGCQFEGGNAVVGWGIYRYRTVNTELISCFFRGCERGIYSEKSEGLKIIGGVAIGCTAALTAIDDIGVFLTQVMWDYNDQGCLIHGCGTVVIGGQSYITGRTADPVIEITNSDTIGIGQSSRKVRVADCSVLQNGSIASSVCISIDDSTLVEVTNCQIGGYVGNGIEYDGSDCTYLRIADNVFDADAAVTGKDISYVTSECNSLVVTGNTMDAGYLFDTSTNRKISQNIGLTTENVGTATVLSGTTSITVTHGLATTPPIDTIHVTPQQTLSAAKTWWVSDNNSTTFKINVDVDPTVNVAFSWMAKVNNRW